MLCISQTCSISVTLSVDVRMMTRCYKHTLTHPCLLRFFLVLIFNRISTELSFNFFFLLCNDASETISVYIHKAEYVLCVPLKCALKSSRFLLLFFSMYRFPSFHSTLLYYWIRRKRKGEGARVADV